MAELPGYDAWLERPYAEAPDTHDCPQCGGPLTEDKRERSVECEECGYSDGFDWDTEAERRAEARAEARMERDEW